MGEIDCEKPDWQKAGIDLLPALGILKDPGGRIACRPVTSGICALLADCGEAVICGQENIRVRSQLGIAMDVAQDLLQVTVGILDGSRGGRSIDSRNQLVQTVALVVLCAIRITGPVNQNERLSAVLEHRQDHSGRSVCEIHLLSGVRIRSASDGIVPCRLIPARSRCWETRLYQSRRNLRAERNSVSGTCRVVNNHGLRYREFAVGRIQLAHVLDRRGPNLSYGGCGEPREARGAKERLLAQ